MIDQIHERLTDTSVTALEDKAPMHIHGFQDQWISKAEAYYLDTHWEHS